MKSVNSPLLLKLNKTPNQKNRRCFQLKLNVKLIIRTCALCSTILSLFTFPVNANEAANVIDNSIDTEITDIKNTKVKRSELGKHKRNNSLFSYQISNDITAKLSGYVMLDYDAYQIAFLESNNLAEGAESNDITSGSEFRRSRLSLKLNAFDSLSAKLQLAAEDGELDVKDAYISWSGYDPIDITIGKQKEPFGFEKLLSSRNALMNERSMNTQAFAPGRALGVSFSGDGLKKNALTWQLGYFSPENSEQSAITGRLTYAPIIQKKLTLHLGFAFSERDYGGEEYRINETLEVHTADSLIESKKLDVNKVSLKGFEFLWQRQGLTALAEWQTSKVTTLDNNIYEYDGSNIQLSYLFTMAKRKYKKGMLSGVNFQNQWELTARWSDLNLKEEDRHAETLSLGVNYYFNKHIKFMVDVIHARYDYFNDDALTKIEQEGNALSLRFQYQF